MRGKSAQECGNPLISPRNSTFERATPQERDDPAPRQAAQMVNEHPCTAHVFPQI